MYSLCILAAFLHDFLFGLEEAETANIELSLAHYNLLKFMLSKMLQIGINFNNFVSNLLPANLSSVLVSLRWCFFVVILWLLLRLF